MSSARRKTRDLHVVHDSPRKRRKPKTFHHKDIDNITAKTEPQAEFFQHYSEGKDVVMQIGSAGTGKTLVAMYAALSEVLNPDTAYKQLLIVRSAVQAREIGFLKGDEEEKNEVYEAPYIDLCDHLMSYKSNNYRNLKEAGYIKFACTSFLRGTTFDNTIIVVDEVQNMTYQELTTIMTRVGVYSRIIFCGDYRQTDLKKKNDISGLGQFLKVLYNMSSRHVGVVEYRPEHIVRSGVVKEFLLAEERANYG